MSKQDPTRTAALRRRFESDVNRRFNWLIRQVRALIVREDAFGLNVRWKFLSNDAKLEQFRVWLSEQVDAGVLETSAEEPWTSQYISEGFDKGGARAFLDTRKANSVFQSPDFYEGTKAQFLEQAFGQPVALEKVKLLASRTFTNLSGITAAMDAAITQKLIDGMIRGDSPITVARAIAKEIEGIGRRRALTLARTEIIRAHAEGQLHALEQLGVEKLSVVVEWSTTGDDRVCPECFPLDGLVVSIKDAHGMLPRHPNCRCAWIPANVGEDSKTQLRTPAEARAALDKSIKAEGKGTLTERKRKSRWSGADFEPSPVPDPFITIED